MQLQKGEEKVQERELLNYATGCYGQEVETMSGQFLVISTSSVAEPYHRGERLGKAWRRQCQPQVADTERSEGPSDWRERFSCQMAAHVCGGAMASLPQIVPNSRIIAFSTVRLL